MKSENDLPPSVSATTPETLVHHTEQERATLVGYLHDDIGSLLTGLAIKSQYLADRLEKVNPSLARDARLQTDLINSSLDKIRLISRGLSPFSLQGESLQYGLELLCQSLNELSDMHCDSFITVETPITGEKAEHLFKIAQEALMNALKYAEARTVKMHLDVKDTILCLKITDFGSGIDGDAIGTGIGTQLMSHRTELIGGTITFQCHEEGGTEVIVTTQVP